jgi:hypothetical protein
LVDYDIPEKIYPNQFLAAFRLELIDKEGYPNRLADPTNYLRGAYFEAYMDEGTSLYNNITWINATDCESFYQDKSDVSQELKDEVGNNYFCPDTTDYFEISAEGVKINTGKITYGFMIGSCTTISKLTSSDGETPDPDCIPDEEINPELWTLRTKAVFPFFSPEYYNENDKMELNNVKVDDLFFNNTVTTKDFDVWRTDIVYKNNLAFNYYFF